MLRTETGRERRPVFTARIGARAARAATALSLTAALSACAGLFSMGEPVSDGPPAAFRAALQDRYIQHAAEAYQRGDIAAARFHTARSVQAANGEIAGPSAVDAEVVAGLSPSAQEDLRILSTWLDTAMNADMKALRPEQTARAQAAYDCLIHEAQPYGDAAAREDCRRRVEQTLSALASPIGEAKDVMAQQVDERRDLALAAAVPVDAPLSVVDAGALQTASIDVDGRTVARAPTPSRAPAAAASSVAPSSAISVASVDAIVDAARPIEGDFAVFFERASADITPEAEFGLISAVETIGRSGADAVTLLSHTDPSVGDRKEQALAYERAERVRRYLAERLDGDTDIAIATFSKPKLSAGSVDNVAAALDRRIEIRIERRGG